MKIMLWKKRKGLSDKKYKKKKRLSIKFPDEKHYWNFDCFYVLFEIIYKNFKYRSFTLDDLQKHVKFLAFEEKGTYHIDRMVEKEYIIPYTEWFDGTTTIDKHFKHSDIFRCYRLNKRIKYNDIIEFKKEALLRKLIST